MDSKYQLHIRVDNRLLHGQIVQYWVPRLDIKRIIVASDLVAVNTTLKTMYALSVPDGVNLEVVTVDKLASVVNKQVKSNTMVLISEVYDVQKALNDGLLISHLTLGNIHDTKERSRITDSIYLSDDEMMVLVEFVTDGIAVEIKTLPGLTMRLSVEEKGINKWVKS